ncbi:prepilin-type N-terminal cleavage/methylation domain-containing protein [Candidatus Gracilibacteria bacterium]|nr:prepilin-type N-terminal cleavage/methylation domain-containing protein [Candidatus Gracilibacteria bacterium]NUJ98725.1 prepilin-type N-terminal cleavage/methylation domain-containing protein [Candidatus Gracilibacteria bacterium]
MFYKRNKKAFTLVELVVVVSILAILSTIGFVSYSNYIVGVRDTNRISNIKAMSDGLEMYSTKHGLPLPEDNVEVKANGEIIARQGYAGKSVLDELEFSKGGKDSKDDTYYSYYLTKDRSNFQLMVFLEEKNNADSVSDINFITKTYAEVDYSSRYPIVYGKGLGILTDMNNTPIQEIETIKSRGEVDLGTIDANTGFKAYIKGKKVYSFSGSILNHKLYTLSKPLLYGAPKGCPEGFVGVPGDSNFNQKGFCLSAYEMSYNEKDPLVLAGVSGLSSIDTDWNVYDYFSGKNIASRRGGYPITSITQGEAIEACKSMGEGYHLVTENEWMAMARNVELEGENWTGGEVLDGYITNGNSNDSSHGCSIDLSNPSDPEYTGRRWAAPVGFKSNDSCNETRKYVLSNSSVLRDIGGNVSEHVNKANTVDGSNYNFGDLSLGSSTSTVAWNDSDIVSARSLHGPLLALNGLSHGIGNVGYPAGVSNNVIIRGGGCMPCGAEDTGLYGLELNHDENTEGVSFGFRCAYIENE